MALASQKLWKRPPFFCAGRWLPTELSQILQGLLLAATAKLSSGLLFQPTSLSDHCINTSAVDVAVSSTAAVIRAAVGRSSIAGLHGTTGAATMWQPDASRSLEAYAEVYM